MWFKQILEKSWGKDLLGSILILLIAAISFLWWQNNRLRDKYEAAQKQYSEQIIITINDCHARLSEQSERHLKFVMEANEALKDMKEKLDKMKKKK